MRASRGPAHLIPRHPLAPSSPGPWSVPSLSFTSAWRGPSASRCAALRTPPRGVTSGYWGNTLTGETGLVDPHRPLPPGLVPLLMEETHPVVGLWSVPSQPCGPSLRLAAGPVPALTAAVGTDHPSLCPDPWALGLPASGSPPSKGSFSIRARQGRTCHREGPCLVPTAHLGMSKASWGPSEEPWQEAG